MLTLLRNGRLTSPSHDLEPPCDVLVGGSRILAVGDLGPAAAGLGASGQPRVIDLGGRPVLPGLIDAHVHLTGGGGEGGFRSRVPRLALDDLVAHGVTSVVGVLGTDGVTRTMRDLVASAYALREEGLSAWCYTGNYAVPVVTLTGAVRDDIVFVDPILGVGELAISDHRSSQPTFDELLRVASDAYVAGLTANKPGVMHLHLGDGARGLELIRRALDETELPARIWHPTHLNRNRALWAEAKALARHPRAPYFDVTAFPPDDDPETLSASAAILDWLDAGLPPERLTMSSDGGGCLPVFEDGRMVAMGVGSSSTLLATLRELVAAGVPIGLAASFVTANPARVLGLEKRGKGRVAAGMDADLLVLEDSGSPWLVMANGVVMVADGRLTGAGRGTFGEREREERP
jgi:beta-aspartyl-dipeptidase (metallo-type)